MKRIPMLAVAAAFAVAVWSANTSCGTDAVGLSSEEQVQFDQTISDVAQLKTTVEKLQTDLDTLKKTATDKKLSEATGTIPDIEKSLSTLKGSITQFNVKLSSSLTDEGQSISATSDGILHVFCGSDGTGSVLADVYAIVGACSGNSFSGSSTLTVTLGPSTTFCVGSSTTKYLASLTWTDTTVSGSITIDEATTFTSGGCSNSSKVTTIQVTSGTRIKRIIRR